MRLVRRLVPRVLLTLSLALGAGGLAVATTACSNSDANRGDTQPRNSTEDAPDGDAPGGQPGGSDPEGEGTGSGRGD